jgi:hypothetical protein
MIVTLSENSIANPMGWFRTRTRTCARPRDSPAKQGWRGRRRRTKDFRNSTGGGDPGDAPPVKIAIIYKFVHGLSIRHSAKGNRSAEIFSICQDRTKRVNQ